MTGETGRLEFEIIGLKGTRRWLETRAVPLRTTSNRIEALLGVTRDITERKQAEADLSQSNERFRELWENTVEGIAIHYNGVFLEVNPAICKMFGYTPEQVIGRSMFDLISPEAAQVVRQKMLEGSEEPYEVPARHADGTQFLVELIGKSINYLGKPVRMVAVRDITERRNAEEALRKSEERYRVLTEASHDMITLVNRSFEVEYTNTFAARQLGLDPGQLTGRKISQFFPPQVATRQLESLQRVLETAQSFYIEAPVLFGERTAWLGSWLVPITGDGSEVGSILIVSRDITERKQAEEALKRSEQDYRHLFDNANDVILIFEPEGEIILEANAAACRVYGIEHDELVGMSLKKLTRDVSRGEVQLNTLLSTGFFRDFESIHFNKAGEEIHFLINSSVIEYQGRRAILSLNRDVTERKRTDEKIQRQVRHLSALHEIDQAIGSSVDLRVTLDVFLKQTVSQLKVDGAAILLFNAGMLTLEYAGSEGFTVSRQTQLRLDETHAGRAVLERNTVHIPNFSQATRLPQFHLLRDEGFMDYYAVPLIAKGQVKGVLEIFHRSLIGLELDWLDFLETLSGQAAIAIDNAQLFDDLQRSNTSLTLAYDATIEGWSRAMDLRDKETEGHTLRVTSLTLDLARAMRIHDSELIHIRRGALLHDIGKLGIPDHILLKMDELSEDEWAVMRRHPTYAYEMLSSIAYLVPALDIPYAHHEKWDGSGYPRGLKGQQIPLVARIFAIVDVWDAITSDRPYRPAWEKPRALEFIREQSGKHFDPQVVDAFLQMIASSP
jgi:PAS domain S-box-containing protein